MITNILRIDSSPRTENSVSRRITDQVIEKLMTIHPNAQVVVRDLESSSVPYVTETMIGGYFTPAEERTVEMTNAIAVSEQYVNELIEADTIVIGVPIYNFSVPGVLKAFVDLIARSGMTFKMGPEGYEGLLKEKKAIVVMASGGLPVDSPADFATPYIRQVLNFIGIDDISVIDGSGRIADEEKLARTAADVEALLAVA
ncbi:MAG: NAD(P)H-dependent oxidoreductase [Chloroflexota bacterium]